MKRQPTKSLEDIEAELDASKEDKRTAPKELEPERCDDGLYRVVFNAGGEVPDSLKGRWTSIAKCMAAIDNHKALSKQG